MFTFVFFSVLFAVVLSLYWYFRPAMLKTCQPVFSRFVRERAVDFRLSFVVMRFLVNPRMLNNMLLAEMGRQKPTKRHAFTFLMMLAAEETNTFGLSEAMAIISKVVGWVFVLFLFGMFRNFIIAGITEAVFYVIREADTRKLASLISSMTIKSQLLLDLKNTLSEYKEHKEQKEGKRKGGENH